MPHCLRHAALPSGEDGRGRENRKSMPWRGPAGVSPPHGGVYLRFGNERAKPLVFPPTIRMRRQALPRAASAAHRNGALARRDAGGRCVGKPSARQGCCIADAAPLTQASARSALARPEERRERLRVSSKTPRPQERKARDRARPQPFPLIIPPAPDRHPDGPGLQARSAQRTERVARRAARSGTPESNLPLVPRRVIECKNIHRTYACQKGTIPTTCRKLSQR